MRTRQNSKSGRIEIHCLWLFSSAAFDIHLSLAILRVPEGLDFTGLIAETNITPQPAKTESTATGAANVPTISQDVAGEPIKPSASSASGWSDPKTLSRSQESLHSHGIVATWISNLLDNLQSWLKRKRNGGAIQPMSNRWLSLL